MKKIIALTLLLLSLVGTVSTVSAQDRSWNRDRIEQRQDRRYDRHRNTRYRNNRYVVVNEERYRYIGRNLYREVYRNTYVGNRLVSSFLVDRDRVDERRRGNRGLNIFFRIFG